MAKDLLVNIKVDSSSIPPATEQVENLGKAAEGTTEKVGGMRKEMRAVGEISKVGGEALGGFGDSLGKVGEGGRIAHAAMELMNGGLIELGRTLLMNPIFLLAAAVAGITLALINMNEKTEAAEKAFEKASEGAEEFSKEVKKISDEAAKAADDLAVLNGTMTKQQAEQNKLARKSKAENIKFEQEYYGKRSALLSEAEEAEKRTRTNQYIGLSEEAKKKYAKLEELDKDYAEGNKKRAQETADESIIIDKEAAADKKKEAEKAAKEAQDNLKKSLNEQLQLLQATDKEKITVTEKGTQAELDAQLRLLDDTEEFYKKNAAALGLNKTQLKTILIQSQTEREKLIRDNNDKVAKDELEAQKKVFDTMFKFQKESQDEIISNDDKNIKDKQRLVSTDSKDTMENVNKRIKDEIDLEDAKVQKLKDLGQYDADAAEAHEKKRTEIQQKGANDRQKIRDAEFAAAKSGVDGLSSLLTILSKNGKQSKDEQKALALAQIGIDTAKAISSLVAASNANPTNAVTFGAAGIAQFAAGLASILANIASAKSILESSDSGGGSPSIGSGAAPAPTPAAVTPSASVTNFTGPVNQTPLTQQPTQQTSQKVYVLASDISNVQSQVTKVQALASH